LNTLAALEDVPMHFEILNDGRVIDSMVYLWPYYEVPEIVKNYDVDLVMVMMDAGQSSMAAFFHSPMTPEGIPAEKFEAEFDLRSNTDKFKTGPLHDFFDLCLKKKFLTVGKDGKWDLAPFQQMFSDKEVENQAEDLIGARWHC
jgi:hypothetical protein